MIRTDHGRHRLAFADEAAVDLLEATGRNQLVQAIWWYDHPVDLQGVQQFADAFAAGIGNRVVERSRLVGAPARWVRPVADSRVHIGESVRPQTELVAWADDCASHGVDPVKGPSWRVDVQRFDDGSGGVCFTASHVIGDAFGSFMALRQAISGTPVDPGYDRAGSRSAVVAVISDGIQVARGLPAALRSAWFGAGIWGRRAVLASRADSPNPASEDELEVPIPKVVVRVDLDQWTTAARSRGGNASTLLMAFAARLAENVGHTGTDGRVTLRLPVNVRQGPDDLRALAFRIGRVTLGPDAAFDDHRLLRRTLREAQAAARSAPDPAVGLLPLMRWLPQRAVRGMVNALFAYADDVPVSLSNLGVLPADLGRIDGTEADWFIARPVDTGVRLEDLRRTCGHLVIVASALHATVRAGRAWTISMESYELGADNSVEHLHRTVSKTLEELGVSGAVYAGSDRHDG